MLKNEQTERRVFALKFRTHATNQVLQQVMVSIPHYATTEQVQCVHRGLFEQDAPNGALDALGNPTASVFDLPGLLLWTLQKRNQLYNEPIPATAAARQNAYNALEREARVEAEKDYKLESKERAALARRVTQDLLACLPDGEAWVDALRQTETFNTEIVIRANPVLLRQLITAQLNALAGGAEAAPRDLLAKLNGNKQGKKEGIKWLTEQRALLHELHTHGENWSLAPGTAAGVTAKLALVQGLNLKDASPVATGFLAPAVADVQNGPAMTYAQSLDRLEMAFRTIAAYEADIAPEGATTVYQDNVSSMILATAPGTFKRSKQNLLRYAYVRQLVADEVMALTWASTDAMIADILTKSLGGSTFLRLREALGVA